MSPVSAVPTVMISFGENGEGLEFECIKNRQSVHTARRILNGDTYPLIPAVRDVEVVIDVGANCGSASTFFSTHYPKARVFALEPARDPFSVLARNAQRMTNIEPFNLGLFDRDQEVPLYLGETNSGCSSILRRPGTTERSEQIRLRPAPDWLEEQEISRIDVLKIDTEGCEVPILRAMEAVLPDVQVIYLEFHSEEDRKVIDGILGETHLLGVAHVFFGQGEVAYVSRSLVDDAGDS